MKYNPEEEELNSGLDIDMEQEDDMELEEELLRELENDSEEDFEIQEARHRSNAERRQMRREQQERRHKMDIYDVLDIIKEGVVKYRTQILWVVIAILLIALTAFMNKSAGGDKNTAPEAEQQTQETENTETTGETETTGDETTAPQEETTAAYTLTVTPEAEDSEILKVVSEFYQSYQLSGDMAQVEKYVDSSANVNANQLAINKKYIESVSDFVCYKSDSEHIPEDSDYTVVFVTWKMKFYNYSELLPSVAIVFLSNGEAGYKIHNMTVDDVFVSQKIEENDENYLALVKYASEEEQRLITANPELGNVFTLFREGNAN